MHLYKIPNLTKSFVSYLESLGSRLDTRRNAFRQRTEPTLIHIEKMDNLGDDLIKMKLAVDTGYPWYDVESQTADDYMSYLSTVLGRLPDLQFTPVTD